MFKLPLMLMSFILLNASILISGRVSLNSTWISDSTSFLVSTINKSVTKPEFTIKIISNGIISDDAGHFSFNITISSHALGYLHGRSGCLSIGSAANEMVTILSSTEMTSSSIINLNQVKLSDISSIWIKRYGDGSASSNFSQSYLFSFDSSPNNITIIVNKYNGCSVPKTIRNWDDKSSWVEGNIPITTSNVVIPINSGIIVINRNIEISSLNMASGTLYAQQSNCPYGWSPSPIGTQRTSRKCYKLLSNLQSKDESETACSSQSTNSNSTLNIAHAAQIESLEELDLVHRMCRGSKTSAMYARGCWIGLQDKYRTTNWSWAYPETMLITSFRDWRRYAPTNSTFQNRTGPLCAYVVPSLKDPFSREQGSWLDVSCSNLKTVVCEIIAFTSRFTLTVTGNTILHGGGMTGGEMILAGGHHNLSSFTATQSRLVLTNTSSIGTRSASFITGNIYLEDGSELWSYVPVIVHDSVVIGETVTKYRNSSTSISVGMQPVIKLYGGLTCTTGTSRTGNNITVNARLEVHKTFTIHTGIAVVAAQGGDISQCILTLQGMTSSLLLGGYSMRMYSYDAFNLYSSHRSNVIGEYLPSYSTELQNIRKGVFRIKAQVLNTGATEVSNCILYHASASELQWSLNQMSLISARGGSSVRRYGNGGEEDRYGYTYRIEMNSVSMNSYHTGGISLTVDCIGLHGCGCAETLVSIIDPSGQASCPRRDNVSNVDPESCATPPTITLQRVSPFARLTATGQGYLSISDGTHVAPPVLTVSMSVTGGGSLYALSDIVHWSSLVIANQGQVVASSLGWGGWDRLTVMNNTALLVVAGFAAINQAPVVTVTITSFSFSDDSLFLIAASNSSVTLHQGNWNGGSIGGLATFTLTGNMTCAGQNDKLLRFGSVLHISNTAKVVWDSGNIGISDGSNITIAGIFEITSHNQYQFKMGHILDLGRYSVSDKDDLGFLYIQPQQDWNYYFDWTVPVVMRTGWYTNPVCGDLCGNISQISLIHGGSLRGYPGCNVSIVAPLYFHDQSQLILHESSAVTIKLGGSCTDTVTMTVSKNSTLQFDGNHYDVLSHCQMTGRGEILLSSGTVNLPSSNTAHITVVGGSIVWPMSRGTGSVLKLLGGLTMHTLGVFVIEPTATTIIIHGDTRLSGNSHIQFPEIGIAAEPSPYDEITAPDAVSRGNVSFSVLYWDGGTLSGKADFNSYRCFLGGETKKIMNLAKLINRGHTEWSHGDIFMENFGDFVNLGTVQMSEGTALFTANDYVHGSVIPIANGGDALALDFHSWDLDQGGLDYTEYIELRTEFVSRAPRGWRDDGQ